MNHTTQSSNLPNGLWALCLLLGGASAAMAQSQAPIPAHAAATTTAASPQATFDFRYQNRPSAAVQVFDDGQDTFVTFPTTDDNTPLLVVDAENQPVPVLQKTRLLMQHTPQPQEQIQVRLKGLHRHFWLHWPERPLFIRYTGTRTASASTAPGSTSPAGSAKAAGPDPAAAPAVWDIQLADRDLATVFERWTQAAGMKLLWDARQHFLVSAADRYTGRFEDAIARVLSSPSIRQSKYPLEACIHPNTPPVLRITRLGEQDCTP